mmetsp:Transcript_16351/g.23979  ORF Transcript_16351/g.23979 Transcript_16351/m.23979 type:complete len:131 (+) Transcript_16351:93-485(+)
MVRANIFAATLACLGLGALRTESFTVAPPTFDRFAVSNGARNSPTARRVLLSEEETNAIMSQSIECSEGECSVEDVNNLIGDLKHQKGELDERLVTVTKLIDQLRTENQKEDRPVNEVRETIKAFTGLFN